MCSLPDSGEVLKLHLGVKEFNILCSMQARVGLEMILREEKINGVREEEDGGEFDPAAPPPFKLSDIRVAIPKHCWVKNPWRSMSYIVRDVAVASTFHSLFQTTGEEQEKAGKEFLEVLKVLEEQGLGDKMFFGGDAINLVDIAHGCLPHWFETIQEVIGIKLLEPTTLPRLYAWFNNFKEVTVIKENLPDPQKLLVYIKNSREKLDANQLNSN
ncbi:hypothetical protein Pint_25224 [Pistacia integerrima]|uniref:Uncharacterized protein n=1 Tax=Pistacia integerrima TaxID=434235 RepID=A0ACC0YDQ3_9ROSI|nr:hypothetical protein Pint_25224 [Pistacia integerrima]